MKRVMKAKVGGKYIIVPKLVGLLLVLVALFMFLGATMDIVVSWDKIKDVKSCLQAVNGDEMGYLVCATKAVAAGVYPFPNGINHLDKWTVLAYKAGAWVFWVLILVLALVIYQTGKLFEIEEEIRTAELTRAIEEAVEKAEEKKEKKTKKTRGRKKKAAK